VRDADEADVTDLSMPHVTSRIREALGTRNLRSSNELEVQDRIEDALKACRVCFEREVRLNESDRLDFLVYGELNTNGHGHAGPGVAIEVKLDGSLAALTRQLHRYAQHERVLELVAVTNRARLTHVPRTLNGKRVEVYSLLAWAL
jgi:hypothetical protein